MAQSTPRIDVPQLLIDDFCRKWNISELSLFGSVLSDDFTSESDVDVLVTFFPDAKFGLFDMVHMENELKEIFGRDVDLVERAALRNPFRRRAILENTKVVYEAPGS